MLRRLKARDGVSLAYYRYGVQPRENDAAGQVKPTVFFSHATGFHGRIFDTTIGMLADNYSCYSMDHRGHGRSGWGCDKPLHWSVFANDLLEVSQECCGEDKVVGVGHSMGAAALLMAALKKPEKFSALVLYEPIIFPPEMRMLFGVSADSPLAVLAKKRRNSFGSHDEAIRNFSKKPPMNAFDSNVLRDFVMHGQVDTNDGLVYLRCQRENEAAIYNSGSIHTTWSELSNISVPTVILAGKFEWTQPSMFAQRLARNIPGSKFIRWDNYSHFGPLEDPTGFANVITSTASANSIAL
ncbi:unnamed protein product [Ectocarpus fasciculatus]